MFVRLLLLPLAVTCAFGRAGAVRLRPDATLGFRYEPGVETRLLFNGSAELDLGGRAGVWAGLALGAIDNPGLALYGVGVSAAILDTAGRASRLPLLLRFQVNHDQWTDWRAGENRVAGIIGAKPLRSLELDVGLAWRVPVFDSLRYGSPFLWSSDAPEWNYVYRLDWTFLARDRTTIAAWVANLDRLTVHNPQQFPFGLRAQVKTGELWRLNLQVGSSIKGFSSVLFSLGELNLQVGACGGL